MKLSHIDTAATLLLTVSVAGLAAVFSVLILASDLDAAVSPSPTVAVAAAATTTEGTAGSTTTAAVTISLSAPDSLPITVRYSTADGTATVADNDYVGVGNGTLVIPAGDSTGTIHIVVNGDDAFEADEFFTVALLSASTTAITQAVTIVTIVSDDPPTLTLLDPPGPVVESQPTTTVQVALTGSASGGVQVDVTVSGGTATAGEDFVAGTSTLVWGPDHSGTRSAIIGLVDDTVEEDAETVLIRLTNATSSGGGLAVAVAQSSAALVLTDDEPAAKVVAITSAGEAVRGDQFFLAVAAAESPALNLTGTADVLLSPDMGLVTSTALQVSEVDPIVMRMHGLDSVRSKTTTHVLLFTVPSTQPLGTAEFQLKLDYPSGPFYLTTTAGAALGLEIVADRGNRNYYLWPGMNFVGLGLVPANSSTAHLVEQPVTAGLASEYVNSIRDVHGREPQLKDVVEAVFVFDCPDEDKPSCVDAAGQSTAGWNSYHTSTYYLKSA